MIATSLFPKYLGGSRRMATGGSAPRSAAAIDAWPE